MNSHRRAFYVLLLLALSKFVLHLVTHQGYGYFRDEFYYIACSERLDWGYVDQPPFSLFVLRLNRLLLGDSLLALRFLPAVAGALTVLLTGLIARRLGGNIYAQAPAALAALVAGSYLGNSSYYSMNSFDLLFWTLGGFTITFILTDPRPRYWLILGVVIGLGLLNKISMLWFGGGLAAGLILTPFRRLLLTKGPWLAASLAFLIFLPHILWQIQHDWPTLEFIRNATSIKMAENPPSRFLLQQVRSMNYFTLPIWIAGIAWYFSKKGSQFRVLGWIYLFTFLLLIASKKSRSGYLAPAYVLLFAAGAVYIESWIRRFNWNWIRPAYALLLLIGMVWRLPFSVAVLPVESYIRYAKLMGVAPSTAERKELAELPQFYADMHGWKDMVSTVARVCDRLSPEEKRNSVVFAQNYGEAGAVSFLGRKYDLPPVISGHNNYWIWGPGDRSGDVVIVLGGDREDNEAVFESVEHADTVRCRYCMPYENNLPVFIGRKLRIPITQLWPDLKHYD
jgi:4-amino-4-deoxy-L-arabinose transferase-like glycosyltransferase